MQTSIHACMRFDFFSHGDRGRRAVAKAGERRNLACWQLVMHACHCVISRFCEEIRRIWPVISALFSSGEAVDDLNPGADSFTFNRRAGYQSRFRTLSRHEGSLSLRCFPVFGPARVLPVGLCLPPVSRPLPIAICPLASGLCPLAFACWPLPTGLCLLASEYWPASDRAPVPICPCRRPRRHP